MISKKTWSRVGLFSGVLIIITFLLITTNFQVRVSMLLNQHGCSNLSSSVSSDGKWLLCNTTDDFFGVNLFSTNFPFQEVKVLLPSINAYQGEGLYNAVTSSSWSLTGSNLVVNIIGQKKTKEMDFCIIQIQPKGSYLVNCYTDPSNQNTGFFKWSVTSESALYTVQQPDGSFEITILNKESHILDQFSTPIVVLPQDGEELGGSYFMWNGSNIYLWLGYREKNQKDRPTQKINRTVVYHLLAKNTKDITLLIDEKGHYDLESIDPGKKYLLLIQKSDKDLIQSNKVQIIDAINGGLIEEISINPLNKEQYYNSAFCSLDCRKTAIEMYVEGKPQIFVWSWEKMNYTILPNNQNVYGRINKFDGFLCLSNNHSHAKLLWLSVCK